VAPLPAPRRGEGGLGRAARWISIAGHPFTFISLLALSGAIQRQGIAAGLRTGFMVILIALVPIGAFMLYRVRVGAWKDVDASRSSERPALYLIALLLVFALFELMARRHGAAYLNVGVLSVMAILLLGLLLNRWIKASLHMAFCLFVGTFCLSFSPVLGIAVLLAAPFLFWARVRMGRHTVAEVVAGTGIGLVVGIAALLVSGR